MASTAPDWPALMRRQTAAAYCDMKAPELEGEVNAGRLPMPLPKEFCREQRWSRRALDEALERLSGNNAPNWRERSNLYAQD